MKASHRLVHWCAKQSLEGNRSKAAAAGLSVLLGGGPVAHGEALLLIHQNSLTSYAPAVTTNIQDVRLQAAHRGVNIDGSARTPNAFGWAIYANPAAGGVATQYSGDLRVDLGHYAGTMIQAMPLSNGPQWPIGISYNSRQKTSGAAHHVSDGPQGANWFQLAFPEIVFHDADSNDQTKEEDDLVVLAYGAGAYVEYRRVMDGETATDTFRGVNGAAGAFVFTAGDANTPDLWELTDLNGTVISFHGFDADAAPAKGQIWKITGTDGQVSYIGDAGTQTTAISNGYNADGTVDKIYLPGLQTDSTRVSFSYSTIDSVSRLTDVLIETKTAGTWASPTSLATFADIDYGYYDTAGDPAAVLAHGDAGDLKQVTVTVALSESGVDSSRETVFAYYKGAYNALSNPGNPHELHYLLDAEGARGYDWDQDATFDDDELGAATNDLKPYTALLLTYNSSRQVATAYFNGECGCSGAADGARNYSYADNGSHPGNTGYDEEWLYRTVIEMPEGLWMTQYYDEANQSLSSVRTAGDPAGNPAPNFWAGYVERDGGDGAVIYTATPETITGYTHSSGALTVSSTTGLAFPLDRFTSGDFDGFVQYRQHSQGKGAASEYYDAAAAMSSQTKTVGAYTLTKPLIASQTVYRSEGTVTTGGDQTSFTYAFHSGVASLRPERITTALPAVSSANNGSNSSNSSITYFESDGRAWFNKDALGFIDHTRYNDWGQVEFTIRDADTAHSDFTSVSLPSGLSSTGTELHRKTEFSYDRQGRRTTITTHAGLEPTMFYTRLADQRLVTLSVPHVDDSASPRKYYGPVSYSVSNHAGKVEASGIIAIEDTSGNHYTTQALSNWIDETDGDIEAAVESMTDGSPARLTIAEYDEAGGRLEASQLYFAIPASLPGTEGVNYDETTYTYDDAGRRLTSTNPSGTISKTVFDVPGRPIEAWIGTDNSGGVNDNMTKVSATEYDGAAAGGNSLVTKVTQDPDGDWQTTTDQRVAAFEYDYRNRRIVSNAPVSPHSVSKYDNTGAVLAAAQYSSSSGLTAATDPVTNATNRIALSQTVYDELGRAFKQTRHLIDQADGSTDDDMTSQTWFDELGRTSKTTGAQLSKTSYDRLGRATHRYQLSHHNDAVYTDADDVSGDIVIEQSEMYYDSDDLLVMTVAIARDYDDYGASETTAACTPMPMAMTCSSPPPISRAEPRSPPFGRKIRSTAAPTPSPTARTAGTTSTATAWRSRPAPIPRCAAPPPLRLTARSSPTPIPPASSPARNTMMPAAPRRPSPTTKTASSIRVKKTATRSPATPTATACELP